MNIYRPNQELLVEGVPVTSSAIHVQELMQADYIRLSWSASEYQELPIGSYIEYEGVEFATLQVYKPSMRSEAEYYYEVDFQHPFMRLQYTPCLFKTRNAEGKEVQETDWEYVGSLGAILTRLSNIIKEQVGWELSFMIVSDVPSSATCSFAGNDIFSALNHVAQAFEVEWCVDWAEQKVYYGENITLGESVLLQEGTNVGVASINKNSADVANSYIVRGGTRNITILTASGDNVQTDTRLSLEGYTDPNGKTYDSESVIDLRTDESEPKLSKVLIFDNVYPHLDLYITDIRSRTRRLLDDKTNQPIPLTVDAEGNPTAYKMYAIYYVRLAYRDKTTGEYHDYQIDPLKDIVNGKELTASFEPNEDSVSALAGREFKMTYHKYGQTIPASAATGDSGIHILEGDFEINFVKEGELIIPNIDTLAPSVRDKLVLYNIVMGSEYLASAKSELYAEATKEIARLHSDMNNYTLQSNVVTYNKTLNVGSAVQYKSLNGYTLDTRVLKLEQKIDIPSDVKITIGNAEVKGNIQSLKEEVALANNEVSAMQAMNEAANAMTTAITNTQNSLKEAMAQWQNMWKFDDDGNVFSPYNVYSEQDMCAFGFMGSNLPEGGGSVVIEQTLTSGTEIAKINGTPIYAPAGGGGTTNFAALTLVIDGKNEQYFPTGDSKIFDLDEVYAKKGEGGNVNPDDYYEKTEMETLLEDYVTDDELDTAVKNVNAYTDGKISALNISQYATNQALTEAISGANTTAQGYATQAYNDAVGYADGKFVTKATDYEEITGIKMFTGNYMYIGRSGLLIDSSNSDGVYLGGHTEFGVDKNYLNFLKDGNVYVYNSLKIGNAYLTYDSENNALFVKGKDGTSVNLVATGDVAAYSGLGSGFDTLTDLTLTNSLTAKNIKATGGITAASASIIGVLTVAGGLQVKPSASFDVVDMYAESLVIKDSDDNTDGYNGIYFDKTYQEIRAVKYSSDSKYIYIQMGDGSELKTFRISATEMPYDINNYS